MKNKKIESLNLENLRLENLRNELVGLTLPNYVSKRMFGEIQKKINEIIKKINEK